MPRSRKSRNRARRAQQDSAAQTPVETGGAHISPSTPAAAVTVPLPKWRDFLWSPSRAEAVTVAAALALKTVVIAVMLLFAAQFTSLAERFDMRAFYAWASWQPGVATAAHHFPLNTAHRWYTGDDTESWFLPLANWDAQHYLVLSDYGYAHGYDKTGGVQFYPLYPMLIRALAVFMPREMGALLLGYFFVAGFCVFLYRIAEHHRCPRPWLAVAAVAAFPTAFFTSTFYTEALFLFLITGAYYTFFCARSKWALLFFALLPLSRGAAAFFFGGFMLWAAVEFAQCHFARKKAPARARGGARRVKTHAAHSGVTANFDWRAYAWCAGAFVAGVCAHFAFFHFAAGDAFANLTAQARYGHKHSIANIFDLPRFFTVLTDVTSRQYNVRLWFSSDYAKFDRAMIYAMLLATAALAFLREWKLLCFALLLVYPQAAMGQFVSFGRFALTAAPFLAIALAKYAQSRRARACVFALCAAAFLLQLYLAMRFSVNVWVG